MNVHVDLDPTLILEYRWCYRCQAVLAVVIIPGAEICPVCGPGCDPRHRPTQPVFVAASALLTVQEERVISTNSHEPENPALPLSL